MLNEREVITVAFGNYSALVAAQWANGTSHYDAHHNTLYTECRATDVVGGSGGATGQARARVPRLLLLDAPYASTFDDVQAWEEKYSSAHNGDDGRDGDNAESGQELQQQQQSRFMDASPSSAASVLWGGKGKGSRLSAAEREAQRLSDVARAVQQHTWARHGLDNDNDDGEDEEEETSAAEDDEESEDAYTRLRRELGIAPLSAYGSDDRRNAEPEGDQDDGAEEDTTHNNMPRHKMLTTQARMSKLKHKLFDAHNTVTPWWQYITTGLSVRSVTSVKPLQHVDAAGDIPALHSFGYGVANLRADKRSEVDGLSDALRAQLESADQLQGVQCFTDGDGMFGGAAANVLEQFWDEAGSKTPVVNVCLFTPLPAMITDRDQSRHVAFRERRIDEAALNQLLATLQLSRHTSAVYIPMPLAEWGDFFRGSTTAASRQDSPAWLQDERATAQYIAAVVDTALYGVRDGNDTHLSPMKRGRTTQAGKEDDDAMLRTQGPMFYMEDWCRVVRPAPSLRVAAAMGSLPLPVGQSSELWRFLETNPLLPEAPILDERMAEAQTRDTDAASLRQGFMPLTHAMSDFSPRHSSGQVLGHAVSLRGAGALPSTVYTTREAMLRYALPLGTATYLPLVTSSNYPLSGTFPLELLFADPTAMERQLPRELGSLRETLKSVDVGAHVLSTYASAPMLRGLVGGAQAVLRRKMDRYCGAYEMEKDEWREAVDEGLAMFDDYHHAAPTTPQDSDNDDY